MRGEGGIGGKGGGGGLGGGAVMVLYKNTLPPIVTTKKSRHRP
jgi:hypothetical protein